MKPATDPLFYYFVLFIGLTVSNVVGDDYTPGDFHYYTHESGDVPKNNYQYSVFVPKDYDAKKSYPVVFYLHGGGQGRKHPDQGKWNMVAATLVDNNRKTDAGFSQNTPDFFGYILVSPVKPVATWNARKFSRLYDHVQSKLSIDENRVYVTGFSMGGQGTWHVGCGKNVSYKLAAMMPLGAWGCNYVRHGKTPETCNTLKTPVWVLHCPQDPVSMISEQLTLFQSHMDCGGYGRFTMIPGKRHLSRPSNDKEFFSLRMGWMLSQTYDTPFNYLLLTKGGTIEKVESGDRPYTGNNNRFGFYEPDSVVKITAPETKNGMPFVKWAGGKGTVTDPSQRITTCKMPASDQVIMAIYDDDSPQLVVEGGKATPEAPTAGQIVTITAAADSDDSHFAYWKFSSTPADAVPTSRSISFLMPSKDVEVNVVTLEALPKRRR